MLFCHQQGGLRVDGALRWRIDDSKLLTRSRQRSESLMSEADTG